MKLKHLLTLVLMAVAGSVWAEDQVIFTENFSGDTYNVSWGGTSAGGISPSVVDGVLTVSNGSQSGDRGAYVSFGDNTYAGSAHLTFDMAIVKSGWSGKNNTFYVYPSEEKNRYPSRTDALITVVQDANGAISINNSALGTYNNVLLTYNLYLDAEHGSVKVVVSNGETEINTFNFATTATGVGAFHLTFNKNYGSFSIDNISLTKWAPTAPSHNYTVNAVAGETVLKQIATGVANEGAAYSVSGLNYVVEKDGVCYKLDDADVSGYSKSFNMGTADQTEIVSYAEADDITYFFEAESILSRSYGNANGNYSGGTTGAVYSSATLTMPNIAAGTYKVTVNTSVRRSNEDIFTVQTCTDGETWVDAGTITMTSNVGGDYSADEVVLSADGSIRLVESKSQNMCHYVDYVLVQKLSNATMSVGAAGYATFVAPFVVAVPEGVTAYTVDGVAADGTLSLTSVSPIVANTPVVLEGSLDETPVSGVAVAGTPTAGLLTGVYEDTAAPVGSYVLQNQTSGVGFYKVDDVQPTVGANRAYLTAASGARFFGFGEETAIKAIDALTTGKAEIFDLSGRKLNGLQKGINIVNGVKILVK